MISSAHPTTAETRASDIRIFISSTFQDLRAERDHLIRQVMPEVRRACRLRGGELTEIDLRWGITEQDAGFGHVVAACLDELANRRPFFIGIIGSRYGWIPGRHDFGDPDLFRRFPWLRAAVEERRSLIELEITEGVLRHPMMMGRALFYFSAPEAEGEPADEHPEAREKLRILKERIRASGHPVRENFHDAAELGEWVREDLMRLVDRMYPVAGPASPLDLERRSHDAFARTRRRAYVELPEYTERLNLFLDTALAESDRTMAPEEQGLVVTGESGCGKSALFAHWSDRIRRERPDIFLVVHFLGAAASPGDHVALLRHVMAEIRERCGVNETIPATREEIERQFPSWLGYVQHEKLLLMIDGINQPGEAAQGLAWLPAYIPPHVALIVSTTEGPVLEVLREREWPVLRIQPLALSTRHQIVRRYLAEFGKRVDEHQAERIVARDTGANALHLRTQLEELRIFGSFEQLNRRIEYYLAARNLPELFERVLARLEEDFGGALVSEVMRLLWASRHGLAEDELAALTQASASTLARLLAALDFHLMPREGLFTFYHAHLRSAVEQQYIHPLTDEARHALRLRIAAYFAAQPVSARRAEEQPWQLLHAGARDELRTAVTSIPLAMELLREDDPFQLLQYWLAIDDGEALRKEYNTAVAAFTNEVTDPIAVAAVLERLGEFMVRAGHYDEAEGYCCRALALREEHGGNHFSAIASTRDSLATLLYHTGRYAEAIELARTTLSMRVDTLGNVHPDVARNLTDLGALYHATGAHDEARHYLQRALDATDGSDSPIAATIMNNLGALLIAQNAYHEAAAYFQRAAVLNKRLLGAEHPEVAANLTNLAFALRGVNDLDGAEPHYRAALTICERSLGPGHPQIAIVTTNLGTLYREAENFDAAEQQLARALAIRRTTLGDDHPETLESMTRLGYILKRKGEYEAARELYREAMSGTERTFGSGHPNLVLLRHGLTSMEQAT